MSKIMKKPKIGLLPLYLELYDRVTPHIRPHVEKFVAIIKKELEKRNVEVFPSSICRLNNEFKSAICYFEDLNVDSIITLHLSYSPSLESAQLLAKTKLPVIILDTTPFYEYISSADPDAMMLNHGIHGVQDLCNMLIRYGKKFILEVGHWERSGVLDKVLYGIRGAQISKNISSSRIGSAGGFFEGMGDFNVDYKTLKNKIGIEVFDDRIKDIVKFLPGADSGDVKNEIDFLLSTYNGQNISRQSLTKSVCAGIAFRNWIKENNYTGFTMNFTKFNSSTGLPTIPFLEAEISIANGLGYAGEGDVLTSAFIGALSSVYKEVTFTEMFCPDWKKNVLFLSHMGEVNIDLFARQAILLEKELPFIDIDPPIIAIGRLKKGQAVIINLAPLKDSFLLIVCRGEMLDIDDEKNYRDSIRGWFMPARKIDDFLYLFSKAGGTHHSALIYGGEDIIKSIISFGLIMGWKIVEI